MSFEEWLKWTRGAVGSDSPECMAKWAWKYQQIIIDDLTEKLDIERNNKGANKLNDECLFDTQEEHDRYELEQAIMSCWGITDDLHLLADAMGSGENKRMHHEMLLSLSQLYELKFQKLFKEFNKFIGCY